MSTSEEILLLDNPIAVIDFETTGLTVETDRVVEVAVVRREPDGSFKKWSTLINPGRNIPLKTQLIHGINNEMVAAAPQFSEIAHRLSSMLSNAVVVAHNLKFDLAFLNKEYKLASIPIPQFIGELDTLRISRHIFNFPKNTLTALCFRFGFQDHNAHRALNDAHNTMQIFLKMLDYLPTQNAVTLSEVQQLLKIYARQGTLRKELRKKLICAASSSKPIVIDYISSAQNRPIVQYRTIDVYKVDKTFVEAYCYTREAKREFNVDRIRQIFSVDDKLPEYPTQSSVDR